MTDERSAGYRVKRCGLGEHRRKSDWTLGGRQLRGRVLEEQQMALKKTTRKVNRGGQRWTDDRPSITLRLPIDLREAITEESRVGEQMMLISDGWSSGRLRLNPDAAITGAAITELS